MGQWHVHPKLRIKMSTTGTSAGDVRPHDVSEEDRSAAGLITTPDSRLITIFKAAETGGTRTKETVI